MKDIPAIVQSHMAKRIALYGQEPEQPLVEELFKRYSELQSTNDQAFLDAFQKLYLFSIRRRVAHAILCLSLSMKL